MSIHTIRARHALTVNGWQRDVVIGIAPDGTIVSITCEPRADGPAVGVLLPGIANLHSHSFQRAMAGLTESRSARTESGSGRTESGFGRTGSTQYDSFWTWRQLMYRFLERLTPDDIESIASMVFLQMLQAGYSSVGEFHYLHHQPDGSAYTAVAETSHRIAAAAKDTGIGLTLLPVLYQQGGCNGEALSPQQMRFGNSLDRYQHILDGAQSSLTELENDCVLGVAPHSLRAVPADAISVAASLLPSTPVHIHIAEQTAEVDEVLTNLGARPVEWLLDNHNIDKRWCLVHATHMTPEETTALATSGATAGLCPITEANLGDGIFDGARYLQANGALGIGSDSNVRISLTEELRLLEYGQRLVHRSRAVLCSGDASNGRTLWDAASTGGARAVGRQSGTIGIGQLADLVAVDDQSACLTGLSGDALLDSLIFSGGDALISDVWSAGRHVIRHGHHAAQDKITTNYKKTINRLIADL